MAFQQTPVAGIAPQGYSAASGLVEALTKGYQASQIPRRTGLQDQRQELENSLMQVKAQYAPQMMEAELQKAKQGQQFAPDTLTRAMQGREQVRAQFGSQSPEAQMFDQFIQRLAEGQQGTEVFDPVTGNPLVRIGGSASKGSGGLMQAGNELISPLTAQRQGTVQKQIAGEKSFERYVKEMKNLSKYRTASDKGAVALAGLGNFLGGNFSSPSEYAGALAATELGAESLLSAYGLPSTEKTIARLADVLKPHRGESGDGYNKRITQLESLVKQGGKDAIKDLMSGIRSPIEDVKVKETESVTLTADNPDVLHTAKKYNMSVEDVINRLGGNK